jgi:predicted Zn-dependent protease
LSLLFTGCATPQYAIRQIPIPDESSAVVNLERQISAYQAKEFERQGARLILAGERLWGFDAAAIVERLSRVTDRPSLAYRALLYHDEDPNAAALADGRVYLSSGMLDYLGQRGSLPAEASAQAGRADEPFDSASPRSGRMPSEVEAELAFVVAHELAHTAAQHLVKRYQRLQQQQLLASLVAAGASVATRGASVAAQQAGRLAGDVAALIRDVAISGYTQEQELAADQLGIRYVIAAGYNPQAALELLRDFERFENPSPFLRTHPYIALRREYLQRYLLESQQRPPPSTPTTSRRDAEAQREQLRRIQTMYPTGSVSWKNLQRQMDELK